MKRTILPSTDAARAWWAANPNALKADCFVITLPNGTNLNATEGQWDVTIPAALCPLDVQVTFAAYQYGVWSRGKITSEAGFRCQSNTMTLNCIPKMGAAYPGLSLGILNAGVNHLFDGAHVWVYTAYMPFGQYGNVVIVETKFQGTIIKSPGIGRNLLTFECADPFFLLNARVPSRLIQSSCFKSFADSNCGLDPADYTVDFTAASGSTQYHLSGTALTQPDGYFTEGVVKCLTGANAGLSQSVREYKAGVIKVTVPWLLPVSAGETFAVIKGCDQTPTTCAGMAHTNGTAEPGDWQTRFGGMPFCPVPESTL